jgi:hypothetical protein
MNEQTTIFLVQISSLNTHQNMQGKIASAEKNSGTRKELSSQAHCVIAMASHGCLSMRSIQMPLKVT